MTNTPPTEPELQAFRQQIDAIDDKLFALLKERIQIVAQVGEYKRRHFPGICPIRPAREAEMVRRVMDEFEGTLFPPAAAAAMWRILIGASTSVEAQLVVSVFAPDREDDMFWLAREYFGPFITIIRQPHIKRVIGDVMDGKAAVGVVPMLRSDDTTFWWTNLLQEGSEIPKVFARIPFLFGTNPGRSQPSGLAFSRLTPENSGNDNTLIAIEADANVSLSKLQTTMIHSQLEARWINIATLHPSVRHHLVELKGFVTAQDESFRNLVASLGSSVLKVHFLGAYAIPINMNESAANDARPTPISATAAK
ncbi:MAG: chorismate mutase [Rickettsiales bacterium]|nr:chorismate mutase [Rickettsiales bacterium]